MDRDSLQIYVYKRSLARDNQSKIGATEYHCLISKSILRTASTPKKLGKDVGEVCRALGARGYSMLDNPHMQFERGTIDVELSYAPARLEGWRTCLLSDAEFADLVEGLLVTTPCQSGLLESRGPGFQGQQMAAIDFQSP